MIFTASSLEDADTWKSSVSSIASSGRVVILMQESGWLGDRERDTLTAIKSAFAAWIGTRVRFAKHVSPYRHGAL